MLRTPRAAPNPHLRSMDQTAVFDATARLIGKYGSDGVSMEDIAATCGLRAAAIYDRFDTKSELLIATFDHVIDALILGARPLLSTRVDRAQALERLVEQHVDFVLDHPEAVRAYYREAPRLPPAAQRHLRAKQAHYLEAWGFLVAGGRPLLDAGYVETVTACALGAIHSVLTLRTNADDPHLRSRVIAAALRILQAQPSPSDREGLNR